MATKSRVLDSPPSAALVQLLVASFLSKAPPRFRCIFLNCEFQTSSRGTSICGDLFAVTKSVLREAKRRTRVLEPDELQVLLDLAPQLIESTKSSHVIMDMIVHEDRTFSSFISLDPLQNIGVEREAMFRSRHRLYTDIEPWLSRIWPRT